MSSLLLVIAFWLFVFTVTPVNALYSISYYSQSGDEHSIVNAGLMLNHVPDPQQVADLYARLSGLSPILSEGEILNIN